MLALIMGVLLWVMQRIQRPGHWWGDDWALYIRQAEALLDGNPNRVAVENAFTVSASKGPAFSPPLYPWGFPFLLAPAVAVFGADVDRLVIVEFVAAIGVALGWYALARRRLGTVVAMVGMVALAMSPLLLSWTELIQSELPFMAVAFGALVAIDAAVARDVFDPAPSTWSRASWWWLALVGFSAAAAFTVRREGLSVVPAIAAAQLVAILARPTGARLPLAGGRPRLMFRLAFPHAVAAALVFGLQIAMPSTVVPRYSGTSLLNIAKYPVKIAANLAETVGLKRAWQAQPEILSNTIAGWLAVGAFLILGVIGLGLGLTAWRRRDAHVAVYTIVAFVIGGSFRSAINRYVASVGPLLLLFGLCVIAALIDRLDRRWLTVAVPTALLLAIIAGDVANIHRRIGYADAYAAADSVEWGPTHPEAQAMFAAVESLSQPDDVIAAPKARAMVLETGRMSVQVDDYRAVPDDIGVDLVVVERDSDILDTLNDEPDDYRQVWSNTRFVIFEALNGDSAN